MKKTKYDINIWNRYFESENEPRDIESILTEELNVHVCPFFMHAKKKNGPAYEPNTLTCFFRSLQRYLKDKNSVLTYSKIKSSMKLEKCCQLKKVVVRENAQAARELIVNEEDQLFRLGEFGDSTPEALQRTV